MNVRLAGLGLLFAASLATACRAEEIEVVAQSANVKVGDKVIASVNEGDRFLVRQRSGPWIAIRVKTDKGERDGWILGTQTQLVLAEGVTADSAAPGAPQFVELEVRLTQVTYGSKPHLFLEVSLVNKDTKTVEYKREDFTLEIDGNAVKPVVPSPTRTYFGSVYTDSSMSTTSGLKMLKAGEIAAGGRAGGWLQFELPRTRQARELSEKKWMLIAKIGDQTVKLDLKKAEEQALGAQLRKARLDDSVQILTVGSRVNGLNVTKLVELLAPLIRDKQGVIITFQEKNCLVDSVAGRELQMALRSRVQLVAVDMPSRVRSRFGYPSRTARTEQEAVMLVLGGRSDAGPRLVKHLDGNDAAVRIAAAQALRKVEYDEGVAAALIQCVSDENAMLQAAAVRALYVRAADPTVLVTLLDASKSESLGLRQAALASLANAKSPLATEAIVQAMSDKNASIQQVAAQAAGSCQAEHVVQPLIKLLDGPQAASSIACSVLAQLKSQEAVPKLRQLRSSRNPQLRIAAAAALQTLGAITPAEAAITRLESGSSSGSDIEILQKSDTAQFVPQLLKLLKSNNPYMVDKFAKLLGEIGDRRAVEPLIHALNYRTSASEEIPRALGLLGDKRAIQPLQQALRTSAYHSQPGTVYQALLALEGPGVFEQIAEDVRREPDSSQTRKLLEVLGNGGPKSVPIIEPFLDHSGHHTAAATSLAQIASPQALAAVRKRLLSKDYSYGPNLVSALAQKPTSNGVELIAEAQNSEHEPTRTAATSQLPYAQQNLSRQRLSLFQELVRNMDFAAADNAFLEILREDLARAERSPALATSLPNHFNTVYSAYQGIAKPELASALLEEAMIVVGVELGAKDTRASRALMRAMRGRQLQMLVSTGNLAAAESSFAAELDVARAAYRENPGLKASRRVRDLLSIQHHMYSRDKDKVAAVRTVFVDFLAAHVKKHGLAEAGWSLTRTSFCPDAVAAHYNPHDKLVYYLRRTRTQLQGGLYRVERLGNNKIAAADRPAALAVDPRNGDIFLSEDYGGRLLHVPLGGQQSTPWIPKLKDRSHPVGIAIAPPDYAGPLLKPGEALFADRGNSGIWKFSTEGPPGRAAAAVHAGDGTLAEPTDIAIGKSAVYVVDGGKKRIFSVGEDGVSQPLVTQQPIGKPVGVAVDPRDGSLLVLDAESNRVARVDPSTGAVSDLLTGLFGLQSAGVDISPDGARLYVTDTEAGAVFTLSRK